MSIFDFQDEYREDFLNPRAPSGPQRGRAFYNPAERRVAMGGVSFPQEDVSSIWRYAPELQDRQMPDPGPGWEPVDDAQMAEYLETIAPDQGVGQAATEGLRRGMGVLQSMAGSALQLFGAEEWGGQIKADADEAMARRDIYSQRLEKIDGIGDVPSYVVGMVAEQLPMLAATAVGGATGALATLPARVAGTTAATAAARGAAPLIKFLGNRELGTAVQSAARRKLAGEKLSPNAERLLGTGIRATGALLGVGAASYGLGIGDVYGELRDSGIGPDDAAARATAFLAGIPYAAMDLAAEGVVARQLLTAVRAAKPGRRTAALAGAVGRGAAGAGLAGAAGEAGQEGVVMGARALHTGEPVGEGEDLWMRVANAAAAGLAGGAVLGGLARGAGQMRAGVEQSPEPDDPVITVSATHDIGGGRKSQKTYTGPRSAVPEWARGEDVLEGEFEEVDDPFQFDPAMGERARTRFAEEGMRGTRERERAEQSLFGAPLAALIEQSRAEAVLGTTPEEAAPPSPATERPARPGWTLTPSAAERLAAGDFTGALRSAATPAERLNLGDDVPTEAMIAGRRIPTPSVRGLPRVTAPVPGEDGEAAPAPAPAAVEPPAPPQAPVEPPAAEPPEEAAPPPVAEEPPAPPEADPWDLVEVDVPEETDVEAATIPMPDEPPAPAEEAKPAKRRSMADRLAERKAKLAEGQPKVRHKRLTPDEQQRAETAETEREMKAETDRVAGEIATAVEAAHAGDQDARDTLDEYADELEIDDVREAVRRKLKGSKALGPGRSLEAFMPDAETEGARAERLREIEAEEAAERRGARTEERAVTREEVKELATEFADTWRRVKEAGEAGGDRAKEALARFMLWRIGVEAAGTPAEVIEQVWGQTAEAKAIRQQYQDARKKALPTTPIPKDVVAFIDFWRGTDADRMAGFREEEEKARTADTEEQTESRLDDIAALSQAIDDYKPTSPEDAKTHQGIVDRMRAFEKDPRQARFPNEVEEWARKHGIHVPVSVRFGGRAVREADPAAVWDMVSRTAREGHAYSMLPVEERELWSALVEDAQERGEVHALPSVPDFVSTIDEEGSRTAIETYLKEGRPLSQATDLQTRNLGDKGDPRGLLPRGPGAALTEAQEREQAEIAAEDRAKQAKSPQGVRRRAGVSGTRPARGSWSGTSSRRRSRTHGASAARGRPPRTSSARPLSSSRSARRRHGTCCAAPGCRRMPASMGRTRTSPPRGRARSSGR